MLGLRAKVMPRWGELQLEAEDKNARLISRVAADPTGVDMDRVASAAREIGTFSFLTKGANPKEVTGKFVVVWEKIGSDWELASDIWNEGK